MKNQTEILSPKFEIVPKFDVIRRRNVVGLLIAATICLMFTMLTVFAQVATNDPSAFIPVLPDTAASFLAAPWAALCGKYGFLVQLGTIMGSLRLVFKPVMTIIENSVANDPAKKAALEEFEHGKIYGAIAWVLDCFASIKLKQATVAVKTN